MTSFSCSYSGVIVATDALTMTALCSLSWTDSSQQSWFVILLMMKEALLVLCLVSDQHTMFVSYMVLLLGTGPSFLLALLASSTSFPGSRMSQYALYASWGKMLVLFLDQHVLSHLCCTYPSLSTFVIWGTCPILAVFFLLQYHNVLEGNVQRWCWLMTWWVQDGFLLVLGSSGLASWWIVCLYVSTSLLVPVEAFSLGSLGLPYLALWWVKALVQGHVFLAWATAGIFYCLLTSVLVLLASVLS